jgi:uncharacterized radical SAM superfamily protein
MLFKKGLRGGKTIWECDECFKLFEVTNSRANEAVRNKQNKFCSINCRKCNWKKYAANRLIEHVNTIGNSLFKGGIGITTDGYIWIRIKGNGYHHNQIKLHRYLMEIKLGRKLLEREIIHHIDENKLNNDINNLMIVTRAQHNRIHKFFDRN